MEVKELMNPSVVTIEPTASAALAARLISRHNVGALPVCGRTGGCVGWSQTGILYCGVWRRRRTRPRRWCGTL